MNVINVIINSWSSYHRLFRIVAYIFRIVVNKQITPAMIIQPTVEELEQNLWRIIIAIQQIEFVEETERLQNPQHLLFIHIGYKCPRNRKENLSKLRALFSL